MVSSEQSLTCSLNQPERLCPFEFGSLGRAEGMTTNLTRWKWTWTSLDDSALERYVDIASVVPVAVTVFDVATID